MVPFAVLASLHPVIRVGVACSSMRNACIEIGDAAKNAWL